jgi:hypothetical protein
MNPRTWYSRVTGSPAFRMALQICVFIAGATATTLQPAATLAASAAAPSAIPLTASAQAAAASSGKTIVKVTSKGLGAQLTANWSDSCSSGIVRVEFDASAIRDTSATPKKTATSSVLISIFGFNSCSQTDLTYIAGADIPYSVQKINGRTLPVSISLSAQNFPNFDGSDTVQSFQMTVNAPGPDFTSIVDEWDITNGTPTTRVHTVRSGSQANVTGTISISTQSLGVLPVSGSATGVMFDSQSNVVTITR